jgi:hypothetical protein
MMLNGDMRWSSFKAAQAKAIRNHVLRKELNMESYIRRFRNEGGCSLVPKGKVVDCTLSPEDVIKEIDRVYKALTESGNTCRKVHDNFKAHIASGGTIEGFLASFTVNPDDEIQKIYEALFDPVTQREVIEEIVRRRANNEKVKEIVDSFCAKLYDEFEKIYDAIRGPAGAADEIFGRLGCGESIVSSFDGSPKNQVEKISFNLEWFRGLIEKLGEADHHAKVPTSSPASGQRIGCRFIHPPKKEEW